MVLNSYGQTGLQPFFLWSFWHLCLLKERNSSWTRKSFLSRLCLSKLSSSYRSNGLRLVLCVLHVKTYDNVVPLLQNQPLYSIEAIIIFITLYALYCLKTINLQHHKLDFCRSIIIWILFFFLQICYKSWYLGYKMLLILNACCVGMCSGRVQRRSRNCPSVRKTGRCWPTFWLICFTFPSAISTSTATCCSN